MGVTSVLKWKALGLQSAFGAGPRPIAQLSALKKGAVDLANSAKAALTGALHRRMSPTCSSNSRPLADSDRIQSQQKGH